MSIVPMKRVSVCGLVGDKDGVLDGLQRLGCLHLVSLRKPPKEPEKAAPARPEDAYKALRYLHECPLKRHQVRDAHGFSMDESVSQALAVQHRIRAACERRDFLAARIKTLEPWGDFKLPSIEALAGLRLWFYAVPPGQRSALPRNGPPWQIVHRDNRFAYVVAIAAEEPPAAVMPVPRTRTGALSLGALRAQLNRTELELEDLQAERESLTRWIFLMKRHLAEAEDRTGLAHAAEQTLDAGELFAVQGWAATRDAPEITRFAQGHGLAVTFTAPAPDDAPPTLLDNPRPLAVGEDLVHFYQMPGYRDWDPALALFFSFSLFFAMILSDAGYAALLGALLTVFWRRLGRSPNGRRRRVLSAALIAGALVWGVLAGSYFGVPPPEGSLPSAFRVLDTGDMDAMMVFSLGVGALHLSFANICRAWRLRRRGALALAPIGWILVILGAWFIWRDQSLGTPDVGTTRAGPFTLGSGLLAVFLFGSERPIRRPLDLFGRMLDGLKALGDVTRIFGDVLSYLRLFALGLASASLALTFNGLALQVEHGAGGPGLLFGLLILLIGHGLNIALSVMSGVVHGLRLNYIEFYNWGLSGEGYPFKAFSKKEIAD